MWQHGRIEAGRVWVPFGPQPYVGQTGELADELTGELAARRLLVSPAVIDCGFDIHEDVIMTPWLDNKVLCTRSDRFVTYRIKLYHHVSSCIMPCRIILHRIVVYQISLYPILSSYIASHHTVPNHDLES